jgi:chromosome segregation ATPase
MGIFSKTPRSNDAARERPEDAGTAGATHMEAEDTASNVAQISPFALRMQEKMHTLDGLKTRIGGLSKTFEQMNALAMESQNSIHLLAEFVEVSRQHVETEVRLKSENAKLSTDLLDVQHQVKSLSTQLEEAQAEVHSLRKRSTETRTALETARNDIVTIRDNNKRVNEEYRHQSAQLVEANSQIAEITGELNDLKAKYDSLEEHSESLKSELDAITRREKELQQNLSESAQLLEEEVKKNSRASNELEAAKREIVDLRNDNIDLKSHMDVARQELAYSKSRLEEEQRKHDNEVYALNAEIENLSSQRRIGAQSLQETTRENSSIKERNRSLMKRMQEIELLLDSAGKNHEKDRNELISTSAKLREVNLRYNSALTDLNHERKQNQKYAENLEDLVEENKKLQKYKIQVDTANDQIAQLKSVIANYQMAMEGRGPAEELGITEVAEDGSKKKDGDGDVVVKLRD